MSQKAISLERRLASAQLRPLLLAYLADGIEGLDLDRFDALLVQMAEGDCWQSATALTTLLQKLAGNNPAMVALLQLYAQKQLDLVGVRDGEFVWAPTAELLEND